ncbi:MAG: tetratricopeptide repeat protein [Pelagimonas sp.]|uniref:tetratricopeptide repeat protein n=1 Tax=Pelagimonas sp. TaxID=2073170 RepID=UPI003D6C20E7
MRLLTLVLAAFPCFGWADMSADLSAARDQYLSGNYSEIWPVVQAEAEAGDPVAQNMLGAALTTRDSSKGLPYDPKAGLAWYERAAAQGFEKSVYNLALFWQTDHEGFTADYELSRALAEKVTDMGYSHGPNLIADMFYQGKGTDKDLHKAFIHYKHAADLGSYVGLRAVGYAYFHGEGVERDITLVREYLDRAVAAGDTRSIPDLAYLYEGDEGIQADPLRAYLLYRYGVEMGNGKAALWLANFATDERFDGVWRDVVKGYGYCLKALELEYDLDNTKDACAEMAATLSPSDQDAARHFAEGL